MRVSVIMAAVLQFCLFSICSADCALKHKATCHSCCACETAAPPCVQHPPVIHTVPTCNSCCSTRCCSYDYANFNQQFYAEFYARNGWYIEAKKREAAEKRKAYEAIR